MWVKDVEEVDAKPPSWRREPGGRGIVAERSPMRATARSNKESQNTSLSIGTEPCWAFLPRKSNQRLVEENI